jgi:ribonuclease Y
VVAVVVAAVFYGRRAPQVAEPAQIPSAPPIPHADLAEQERKQIILAAQEEALRIRSEADAELREQRAEVSRGEQRIAQREDSLERRRREIETGEQKLERREVELTELQSSIAAERAQIQAELERVAGLSQDQAKAELLGKVEADIATDVAERIRLADERLREEVAERSRDILVTAMQRIASDQTGEASVTVMHLPSDELKGRVIGREGRNIRALEAATGVDVIVDETPETVVISAFDPVRREVARVTLERLFADGRIHPARIEEMVNKTREEITQRIREEGEAACQEFSLNGMHPELHLLLGTLRFRNSYGQNVLSHSREVASLCGILAGEVGYDPSVATEIGLFHDLGKAAAHEADGAHALIGAEILQRLGRPAEVIEAVRSHHYDSEPKTAGAVILMTADAISASRRGSRRESLSSAIKRLERLEEISAGFDGVETAFAVQAGKEIRVIVRPGEVSDDQAQILARQIAKRLHGEGSYTGKLKVAVLRETRAVEYAK